MPSASSTPCAIQWHGCLSNYISSKIFLHCFPPHEADAQASPMLFMNVCNAWSDIALSTPELWAAIDLDFPSVQILETWLQRAGNYPLSVNLRRSLNHGTATVLSKYAEQLKHLEIHEEELDTHSLIGLESFPFLETLTIGVVLDDEEEYSAFSIPETIRFLRLAPNLEQCTLYAYSYFDADSTSDEKSVLPKLTCLEFGNPGNFGLLVRYFEYDDTILRHLTLPALQTLLLPFTSLTFTDFSHFLKRSSPPLRKLILGRSCGILSSIELEECLRLVPSLTHLELLYEGERTFLDDLFSALGNSPSHFLPNPHTLKLQYECDLSASSYQRLHNALSARRAQIVSVDLRNPFCCEDDIQPEADICAASGVRQLVTEGMEIYIGTQNYNFLSK
ncbi:hypothetical protein B0H19DRAFT_1201888 [Mycena capillaripes]|nr:hypothetical protein B0H19DRAFT_1201888 [Mycena capillaripes]